MRVVKNTFLFLLWVAHILVVSCDKDDDKNNPPDCTDVTCTEIFVTLTVTVKDASGVVVPLDSFSVVNLENNEDLTRELSANGFEMARQTGTYPLFGDEYVESYQNDALTILFKGFIDGEEVVNAQYEVGADCCHVLLRVGETDIVITE